MQPAQVKLYHSLYRLWLYTTLDVKLVGIKSLIENNELILKGVKIILMLISGLQNFSTNLEIFLFVKSEYLPIYGSLKYRVGFFFLLSELGEKTLPK